MLSKVLKRPKASEVVFSNNGEFLATGGGDGTVELWKSSEGTRLFELQSHFLPVSAMAFSFDDSLLVSASSDTTVHVSRVSDGKILLELVAEVNPDPMLGSIVEKVGFSPDMKYIYAMDTFGTASIWTLRDGKPQNFMMTEKSSTKVSRSFEFSSDSQRMALSTWDGYGTGDIALWDLQDKSINLEQIHINRWDGRRDHILK